MPRPQIWVRRLLGACLLAGLAALLPACQSGGNFCVFGYSTQPNYDTGLHTVYVPMFKNLTMWRGMEFELTRAVVREIEARTPYKVVSDCARADTELTGTIISFNKNVVNRNQLNESRELETTLGVEIVWKDLRTGEILSRPRPPGPAIAAPVVPSPGALNEGMPGLPPVVPPPVAAPPPPGAPPPPVLVQSIGGFIPELGQSLTTAQQQNVNRLAISIVSMMEKPW